MKCKDRLERAYPPAPIGYVLQNVFQKDTYWLL